MRFSVRNSQTEGNCLSLGLHEDWILTDILTPSESDRLFSPLLYPHLLHFNENRNLKTIIKPYL
ncbi:ubiquitin specific peptidase 18, isoform CRA_b [Rattus norvegicus]|uniref:Ubiquitin specific peptidase 18, isoform CRA_b n=1 Tax=Rattus norvegicus TaxID=10116 RepID=A6ILC2_RAT|nr:ubiquitin specific peptidase 18, isoform CRA_b [Rattus norvegicus]